MVVLLVHHLHQIGRLHAPSRKVVAVVGNLRGMCPSVQAKKAALSTESTTLKLFTSYCASSESLWHTLVCTTTP